MQKAAAVAASPPTAADPSGLLRAMDPSAVSLLHKLEANKNTSIADLRLKAKHHASLLGYRQWIKVHILRGWGPGRTQV